MKIVVAKIYPENEELLCDLYSRMKTNVEYFINNHQDVSVTLDQDVLDNCILVKSLKLGESAN